MLSDEILSEVNKCQLKLLVSDYHEIVKNLNKKEIEIVTVKKRKIYRSKYMFISKTENKNSIKENRK